MYDITRAKREAGPEVAAAVRALNGLNHSYVAGAAAGTDMPVPGMRENDVLVDVLDVTNQANDTANVTVQSTFAAATISFTGSAGTPADADTISVSDLITPLTITFESTVTDEDNPINRVDANNVNVFSGGTAKQIAQWVMDVLNVHFNAPNVDLADRTIRSDLVDAGGGDWDVEMTANNPGDGANGFTLSEVAANVTVSGANFTGGRDDTAITSTTAHGTNTLLVIWLDVSDEDLAIVT